MKGISEEEFYNLNEAILDALTKAIDEKNEINDFQRDMSIRLCTDELIDESKGFIDTKDSELEALFQKLFNLSASIKKYSHSVQHFLADVKRAKNDKEIKEAAELLTLTSKVLEKTYQKAFDLAYKINEHKNNKNKK